MYFFDEIIPIIEQFENLSLCETIIFNHKVANQNEIDKYLNRFKGLGLIFKRSFIEEIKIEYNKNVFNSEIEEKEIVEETKKERIEKDDITLKLENIEYLLLKVKQRDIQVYSNFIEEYSKIISSDMEILTLTPICLESLTLLEGKIEFYLDYSKNTSNNILELLNNLKNEYLENFQNDNDDKTKLTISDIDKLSEIFLKTKNDYAIKNQLQILKDIAFLYIMEILEDTNITPNDLQDSYFKDNLKYIIIVIMSLIDDDIIEDNIIIDLDTELDIYNIFNIIKNIGFKKQKTKRKNVN